MGGPRLVQTALALLLVAVAGCGRREWKDANVVIIAIDTLRADHVGAYGYPRPTTPRIDAFAKDATVFETAISASSWTLPAFASIFTGLLPSYHRAGEGRFPALSRLDETPVTLAGLLAARGYRTASFVSNVWVGAEVGMARDFQEHEHSRFSSAAVDRAVEWLGRQGPDPFFLFVHIMEPHRPYAPPAEDLAPFADPSYAGPVVNDYNGDASKARTPADRQRVVDLYDGEIRAADRLTGRVLDALHDGGFDDRTIVVVVSDHGEELWERGQLGHGHTLHQELLRVPLIVRFPGEPGRRVGRLVRTMDLFATLLDAVGQPVPANVHAVSLLPVVRGQAGPRALDRAVAEYVCFGDQPDLKAVRTPTHSLIMSPSKGEMRLFDLRVDPGEWHDVAAAEPALARTLADEIEHALVASLDGFHLLAVSPVHAADVRARFTAPTPFRDVALAHPEPGDGFELSEDGRTLDVTLHLVPEGETTRRPDIDGIQFRTADDRAVLLERLELDGAPPPPGSVSLGEGTLVDLGRRLPWPFLLQKQTLVRYPIAPNGGFRGEPAIRLAYVKRGEAPTTAVSTETRERLRALGYLP